MGAGLRGNRSGTFWPFWNLITRLKAENRGPHLVVLENVCGTLSSHGGKDFTAIANALAEENYRFGALIINAANFVPQSRSRLFVVAIAGNTPVPPSLVNSTPTPPWHPRPLHA